MKILIVNVVCGTGSTGKMCTDLAEKLSSQGHEVRIAYGRGKVPELYKKYSVRVGNDFDVYIHALLSRLTDSAGFHSKQVTKKFIEWVKEFDPDIIHLHNIHGYYINVEILSDYLRTCGKRIIWTLHDCWTFTGHSALCDGDNCQRWEEGCGNCPQKKVYPKSYIDFSKKNWLKKQKLFSNIPNVSIITPSHWLENNVKKSFLQDYPVRVISNGIDTSLFKINSGGNFRKKYGLEKKFIVLGVASVWSYKKGFEDFVKLGSLLGEKFQIVLVGVEKKIRTDGYHNITMLGLTENAQELVDIYSSADVFVNLTYCDTFPTVNLEARACGLPIITYDTGGSPEAAGESIYKTIPKGEVSKVAECLANISNERRITGCCKMDVDVQAISKERAILNYLELIE